MSSTPPVWEERRRRNAAGVVWETALHSIRQRPPDVTQTVSLLEAYAAMASTTTNTTTSTRGAGQ